MKRATKRLPRPDHRNDFDRLVYGHLQTIQDALMPDKADMVVAINLETGEYALGKDTAQARAAYLQRLPEGGYYICRVDGSPSLSL